MEIQDEFPVLQNPLADLPTDYRHAVLHIAWDWHKPPHDVVTLLFAFVELLPAEIPAPIDDFSVKDPAFSQRVGRGNEHQVYVRHTVLSAQDAIAWYVACRSGTAVLPDDDGSLRSPAEAGPQKLALLGQFGEAPSWPTLLSAPDDTDMLPFKPLWMQCPRSHHLLPTAEVNLEALWPLENARDDAITWLSSRLHFELAEYPEYWGSVHLLAPNPVYRKLRSRLHRGEGEGESALVRFQPRAGRSVEGLTLLYRLGDAHGVIAGRVVNVRSNVLRFNSPSTIHSTSEDVFDERRGFLEKSNLVTTFARNINMQIGLSQSTRVHGPKSSYVVSRTGKPDVVTVGAPEPLAPARLRLLTAHYARQARKAGAGQHQRWFMGQVAEARAFLRSTLTSATETLLFVDPYFGADELAEFALAVMRTDVPILVLSSAKGLKEDVVKGDTVEKGDALVESLARLHKLERMNPVEIRVMVGDDPIHDRFIVVDKRIWHLGASLHDFGARGTLVLAVPDPEEVRPHLLAAWDDAVPLDQWIEQRRRDREQGRGVPA